MWIVRLALRRPYTFAVLALLISILGALTIVRTPTDIFPNINIPVVSVLWIYNGLSAQEMEGRIVSERAMTTTVNDIEHIESQSLNGAGIGAGVIRVFFQPDASIDAAVAETTAINQTVLKVLPLGTTEPLLVTGIYARTDGYLTARYVDIGDHVTAGQLLADIATPEIDQQLSQSQATLAEGQANVVRLEADLALARTTLKRFTTIGVGAVTQQEIDERHRAAQRRR